MSFHSWALLAVLAALVLAAPRPLRADLFDEEKSGETVSVELGVDVATGTYGNATSTTTVSVPLSVLYFPTDRLDLGASIPYVWQSNGLIVAGRVVRGGSAALKGKAQPGRGAPASPPPMAAAPPARESALSGMGDLVLSGGYALLAEGEGSPQLRPFVNLKCPTAETGLGTGAFDETFGLALTKGVGEWYLFAQGGYTVQGKSSLFSARNFADYELGVGYQVLPGLRPALAFKGASSVQAGAGGSGQLEGKVVYTLNRLLDLKLNLERGLSVTSPDWEGGCFLSFNF